MSFLPPDYAPPQGGHYMKLQVGDNRIRILSSAVVGNVFWTSDASGNRRPVRRHMYETIEPNELPVGQDGKREGVKHFWAFAVWNYAAKQLQILEITQRTIQESIMTLVESDDWGDPQQYDLLIRRTGSGLETDYTVMPGKASDPPAEALREMQNVQPNIEALFDGGDPFAGGASSNGQPEAQQPAQHPQVIACRIGEVNTKALKQGTLYEVSTTMGGFATLDDAVGKQAQELAGTGTNVELTVTDTGKGKRLDAITVPGGEAAAQQQGAAGDDDPIPFSSDGFDGRAWH